MPKPRLSGSASVLPPWQECVRGCGRGQAQEMAEVQDPRKKTQAARGAWYLGTLQRVWLESEPISQCHLLPVRMLFPSPKACSPCKRPPGGGVVPRAHVTPLAIGSPWSARGFVLDSPFLSRTPGIFSCCQLCFKSAIMG